MSRYTIGYIGTPGDLRRAVEADPRVQLVEMGSAGSVPDDLQAIVVETPLPSRLDLIKEAGGLGTVPILTDMPVTGTVAECRTLLEQLGPDRVWSANPLVADPAVRLMAEHYRGGDPLRTVFASTRVEVGRAWRDDLARLVDLASWLIDSPPVRIAPVVHGSDAFALAIVRYANEVVLSLEAGALIPAGTGRQSDLLIECFGSETAYRYAPKDQTLTLEGQSIRRIDWSANPAVRTLTEFLSGVERADRPHRGLDRDIEVLTICEQMLRTSAGASVETTA